MPLVTILLFMYDSKQPAGSEFNARPQAQIVVTKTAQSINQPPFCCSFESHKSKINEVLYDCLPD